jgi:multicomponent Na+:H+ antiporter subunit E
VAARTLLLALAWIGLSGSFEAANFAFGLAVGFLIHGLTAPAAGGHRTWGIRRMWAVSRLAAYFAWQLVLANVRVAWAVLGPVGRLRPALVAVPLDIETDAEIAMLANMITLTPGTLSVEVSPDRRTLYVHTIQLDGSADGLRDAIKRGFERRVREAFR